MYIEVICFPEDDVINFELNLDQKTQDKILNILRTKRAFKVT